MKMRDVVDFPIGSTVYMKIVPEKDKPGMVTALLFRQCSVAYYVTWEDRCERLHYGFELVAEPSSIPA